MTGIPVTTSTSTAVTATTACGPGFFARLRRNISLDGEPPRCTKRERDALWAFRMRQEGKAEDLELIEVANMFIEAARIIMSVIGGLAIILSVVTHNGWMLFGMLAVSVASIYVWNKNLSIQSGCGVSVSDTVDVENCLSEVEIIALRRFTTLVGRTPMDKVASLRLDGDARELLARAIYAITKVETRVEASKRIGAPNGMITGRSLVEGTSTE